MNRFTQKIKDTYLTDTDNACLDYCEQARTYIGGNVLNKLGQLEDIEEELGIDLITLFKALKHKIWIKIAKEQEKELNELRGFARIVLSKGIDAPLINEYPNITYLDYNMKSRFELGNYTQAEFDLVKKVVEKYGKKED